MDIHRCRFVPYPASTINALAFSHTSTAKASAISPPNLRLAIGRANGNIEIWNPQRGHWAQECILNGGKDRSIEGLVWTHDLERQKDDEGKEEVAGMLRLFSIGYSTVITEWDLALRKPIRHSGGNYGEIWCIAAQPRWKAPAKNEALSTKPNDNQKSEQHLAVGCADGTVVLHSTADGDLKFLRTLARPSGKKSRVLSIVFLGRGKMVAGYADSMIRIFNISNGRQLSSMSLGAGQPGDPTEILVWSVRCLSDGTIVSGDSTGEVRFWDGQNYTLLQRIKSHKEDILDIAVSADGLTVFSGGMDRRTTMYRRTGDNHKGKRDRWAEISHQRYHSHDIKTMATFESNDMSVVVSGGVDATPIIIPLREFGKEYTRSLPMIPNCPQVQSAPKKRLLVSWWDREISIWRIGSIWSATQETQEAQAAPDQRQVRSLVAKIVLQGEENIVSVSISADANFVAVSTLSSVKIFHLRPSKSSAKDSIKLRKAEIPTDLAAHGSKLLQFSPDSKWLLTVRSDDSIYLHRIAKTSDMHAKSRILERGVELLRLPRTPNNSPKVQQGSLGMYESSIIRAAWSSDSRILVLCDLQGHLDSWVLEGYEDLSQSDDNVVNCQQLMTESATNGNDEESNRELDEVAHPVIVLGQHWIRNPRGASLPRLPSFPLVMSFRPAKPASLAALTNGHVTMHPTRHNPNPHSHDLPIGEDRLFVMTSLHKVYEYQIFAGKLSDWSRRNPPAMLPEAFRAIRDRAMNCVWDISNGRERVWIYGNTFLWMFDLARDLLAIKPKASEVQSRLNGDTLQITRSSRKRKRKHTQEQNPNLMQGTTGAGSKIPEKELGTGLGGSIYKTTGLERDGGQSISLHTMPTQARDDDDDAMDDDGPGATTGELSALVRLRRENGESPYPQADHQHGGVNGDSRRLNEGDTVADQATDRGLAHWHTFKYRPILGIVSLSDEAGPEDDSGGYGYGSQRGLEVALVERPSWDLDLPPRYHGDQEWDK
ncbi:U3 small nucleolar RNA-associated protein [Xylographa opegraphella]|nr:U3 small nucleolar RNA-associated protein [Xylographa opegraphella]